MVKPTASYEDRLNVHYRYIYTVRSHHLDVFFVRHAAVVPSCGVIVTSGSTTRCEGIAVAFLAYLPVFPGVLLHLDQKANHRRVGEIYFVFLCFLWRSPPKVRQSKHRRVSVAGFG